MHKSSAASNKQSLVGQKFVMIRAIPGLARERCASVSGLWNREAVDHGHESKAGPDWIRGGYRFSEKIMVKQNVREG
jgi:hypothetical protein